MDENVGMMLDELESLGRSHDTIVAFFGDQCALLSILCPS